MERIDGESLERMIARRAHVPLAWKLTYALQACRAFDYADKVSFTAISSQVT